MGVPALKNTLEVKMGDITVVNSGGVIAKTDQVWTQEKIFELEEEILQLPQVNMLTTHDFCHGVYARTLSIPAGVILTGAIHKDESFFVVRSGVLLVTTDTGTVQVGSGFMMVTKPGTKRAGIALTDCEVTTFHANPTNEKDPDAIWEAFFIGTPGGTKNMIDGGTE
jgi:hypothetical protein